MRERVNLKSFLTSTPDWGKSSVSPSDCFTPRRKNSRYSLNKEAGQAPESVWMWWLREKSLLLPQNEPRSSNLCPVTLLKVIPVYFILNLLNGLGGIRYWGRLLKTL
jgi:hypothetical protein